MSALPVTVEYTADVPAAADVVWRLLGDFADMSWNPHVAHSRLVRGDRNMPGAVRELRRGDESVVRERLLAIVPEARSLTYQFVPPAPIPVTGGQTVLTVHDAGLTRCTISWSGHFVVADADAAATVTRANRDFVWPRIAAALRAATQSEQESFREDSSHA